MYIKKRVVFAENKLIDPYLVPEEAELPMDIEVSVLPLDRLLASSQKVFSPPPPNVCRQVTSINPYHGPARGSETIRISGLNLHGTHYRHLVSASIGGIPCLDTVRAQGKGDRTGWPLECVLPPGVGAHLSVKVTLQKSDGGSLSTSRVRTSNENRGFICTCKGMM